MSVNHIQDNHIQDNHIRKLQDHNIDHNIIKKVGKCLITETTGIMMVQLPC